MKAKVFIPVLALAVSLVAGSGLAATLKRSDITGSTMSVEIDGITKDTKGGNFAGSFLDDKQLEYMYCIDLFHSISANTSYTTNVSMNAQLVNRPEINAINAGKIAWLITTQAKTAVNSYLQSGLQAAIWKQVYGDRFTLLKGTKVEIKTAYANYINLLGNNAAPLNSVLWLDPRSGKNNQNHAQDQVAWGKNFGLNTPIPAAMWLFGSAIAGVIGLAKRKSAV